MNEKILDIFYNKVIPEAQMGKIDCYFTLNIAFNVVICNQEISKCGELPCDGIMIPTLKINDKQLFDNMLIKYVNKALIFYDAKEFSFLNDLNSSDYENVEDMKEEYLIKYIIVTLFANASITDFDYPIPFLCSRINMFDNKIINEDEELDLGYINSIGARIYIIEEKSPIRCETPYRIKSYLEFDDGYQLFLPEIYAGNDGEKYKLYGIQKTLKNKAADEKVYLKQIRKGFISKINGAPEHYFLTVMLFLSFCSDKVIEVIPFLVERWNAKKMAMYNKVKRNLNLSLVDAENDQDKIQSNITDIFIRYFTKLKDVSNGLEFLSLPFELDTSLMVNIEDNFESRSVAFNELFNLVKEYKNNLNK